jgi:NAD(P)-dependent dehydrogenase (short-subunit alcohol dehydrogenase family)
MRFKSKHAVVTGGGTGIGRAVAIRLAKEGARVSVIGRRKKKLDETVAQIQQIGADAFAAVCDIRDQSKVDSVFDDLRNSYGPFSYFVANAGVGGANGPGENDRFDEIIRTNISGTYYSLRAAERGLVESGGRITIVSSCLARFGVPGYTGYCASKASLLGLTRALSLELSPNTQVNAICPGWVDTQMARDGIQGMADSMSISYDEALAQAMSLVPAGRMSKPAEIAGMVAWLCSEDSAGMTGQALDMNGGSWMG